MLILWLGALSEQEKKLISELFLDTNIKLYHISLEYLHSPADAEDAVSQSFLRIIDHIEKISLLPCPKRLPYCVVIVKNVCIDMLRKRKAVPLQLGDDINDVPYGKDVIWDTMQYADLAAAMEVVPIIYRRLLQLRYADDMSYKDIATLLGVSEDTAKKRGQRAIIKLRSAYTEVDCHANSK